VSVPVFLMPRVMPPLMARRLSPQPLVAARQGQRQLRMSALRSVRLRSDQLR